MAANTAAIFPLTPKVSWGTILTQNTAVDGTGTVVTIYQAGSNGSRLDTVQIKYAGTTVATIMRFFINNNSTNATATNNSFYSEYAVFPGTGTSTAQADITIPFDLVLPANYKLNITISTTVANNLAVTACGGDY